MNAPTPPRNTIPVGIRKLHRNAKGLKLSIPKYAAAACGWQIGSYIAITINPDDTLTLRAVPLPVTLQPAIEITP